MTSEQSEMSASRDNFPETKKVNSFLTTVFDFLEVLPSWKPNNPLYLVQENLYPDIVSWDSEGESIVIKQIDQFANEVLLKHFGKPKYPSFIRQVTLPQNQKFHCLTSWICITSKKRNGTPNATHIQTHISKEAGGNNDLLNIVWCLVGIFWVKSAGRKFRIRKGIPKAWSKGRTVSAVTLAKNHLITQRIKK